MVIVGVMGAAVLCLLSLYSLRQAFADGAPVVWRGFDGIGAIAGFVVACAAAMVSGPLGGLMLVGALLLHEAGHWAALRLAGAAEPEFRLFPQLTGAQRPDFTDDGALALYALAGPVLSVAPMALAALLSIWTSSAFPALSHGLATLTLSLALVALVSLLPFQRLDGGAMIRAAARALSPSVECLAVACAIAGLALGGWLTGLAWTYAVAVFGLIGLIRRPTGRSASRPMPVGAAHLALAAWAVAIEAHIAGCTLILLG